MLGLAHLGYIPIPTFCSNHGQTPNTAIERGIRKYGMMQGKELHTRIQVLGGLV